jgi:DNA-binding LacI/PurR family transcriptional regulator
MASPSVTIKSIADALGMAHTTVSRALNDHPHTNAETKNRVREMADRLGYVANAGARRMRSGSSRQIGFIVPDVQNEFFNALARSLAEQCFQLGYQLSLGISEDNPDREHQHVRALRENRAEGLIIAPCGQSLPATRALLAQLPHVQVLRFDPQLGKLAVSANDVAGVENAVTHLIEQGHREIAYIGTPLALSTGAARLRGYKLALKKTKINFDKSLIRIGPTLPAFGKEATHELLCSRNQTSAFMVASSRQLVGVLQALKTIGRRVPEDVSVVVYGDADWFELATPSISAVALSVKEMSDRATEMLFSELAPATGGEHKRWRKEDTIFTPNLIIRESIGPYKKEAA